MCIVTESDKKELSLCENVIFFSSLALFFVVRLCLKAISTWTDDFCGFDSLFQQ